MRNYIKPFVLLFVFTFFLNFLLHGLVFRQWNDMHLVAIRETQIRPQILAFNYLLQSAGLLFFLVGMKAVSRPKMAATVGGIYGFLTFINLGLSNLFLIKGYPWQMVITDALINTVVLASACYLVSVIVSKTKNSQ